MKIAQISTPFIAVPPKDYGGIELVVHNLTEGLVKKGHEVTLVAPKTSKTSGKLISPLLAELKQEEMEKLFSPLAFKLSWMHSLPSLYHVSCAFEQARNFDIIHNHLHYLGLFFSNLVQTPVIHTYHGDLSSAIGSPIERMILEKYKNANWIAISESQKHNCPVDLNFVAVIHHGIDIERFSFAEMGEDYLFWLGRVTPKKGLTEAIEAAKLTKHQLLISDVVHLRDQEYYQTQIKPHFDQKQIISLGALSFEEKVKYLKNAKALLYPVSWEEPFGLVMVEAMSTGTPVIGYARGAVTEVIRDGETGFLINHTSQTVRGDWRIKKTGVEGLCEAIEKIYSLPEEKYRQIRKNTRQHVEKNFTLEIMVGKHEKVYQKLSSLNSAH